MHACIRVHRWSLRKTCASLAQDRTNVRKQAQVKETRFRDNLHLLLVFSQRGHKPRPPDSRSPASLCQELGLFTLVFSYLDGRTCARVSALGCWASHAASRASAENVKLRLRSAGLLLSRWKGGRYEGPPFLQQHDLETAARHFATIAGRYSLPEYDCTLDIQPDGSFRNYGSQHEMVGQATIAGVLQAGRVPASSLADVPEGMQVCYICELDRWYIRTMMDGKEMTPEDLEFTGPGYQTYSVLMDFFRRADTDGSGEVSKDEFNNMLMCTDIMKTVMEESSIDAQDFPSP
ncbi:SLC4A10 [Symbiodinium sp. KB8]|nr:SLC4A10 [Symbiodinium sp. KB8]